MICEVEKELCVKTFSLGDAAVLLVNVNFHKIYRLQVEHPLSICKSQMFPQILRPVTIMMRIREGKVLGIIITLCPFHSALELLEEAQQSNPVDSQEDCSDPEENTQLSELIQAGPSRKL
jgi:hypothetical protein